MLLASCIEKLLFKLICYWSNIWIIYVICDYACTSYKILTFYLCPKFRKKTRCKTSKMIDPDKPQTREKQTQEKDRRKKDPIQCPLCPKKTTSDLHLIIHFVGRHNTKTISKGQMEKEDSTQVVNLLII